MNKHPKSTSHPNVLRWDCEKQGCFNKKCRPKIELFAQCFPRTIQMSDIDGEVELNGRWLRLEWKFPGREMSASGGQAINYKRLTKGKKHAVIVVYGNAEQMTVDRVDVWWDGELTKDYRKVRVLEELQEMIVRWAIWAEGPFDQSISS